MYLVGLTGGIASGKSTVCDILMQLGAKIVDADQVARKVVLPEFSLLKDLVRYFGKEILLADGTLNRIALGEKVFGHPKELSSLEKLMHPAIKEEIDAQINAYQQENEKVIFLDIPLLFETGWSTYTNENWVVYVNKEVQLKRLMERNHFSQEQAMARIKSQMALEEKVKMADVVIDNNNDLVYTKQQIKNAWDQRIKCILNE